MKRVVMIGSGNVATSLAHALQGPCEVVQVYSRRLSHAQRLADAVGSKAIDELSAIDRRADVVIVAVPDDAIAGVVDASPATDGLWLHTSGSVPIEVFAGKRRRYGVLYPLQSFSRELLVDVGQVHLFVEGSDPVTTSQVKDLASMLSPHVAEADSGKRGLLHVAAVFACNFANHMWTLASEVLAEHGIPFEALLPLVETTVEKLHNLPPALSQTGPAVRGDKAVMDRHESLLDPDKRALYRMISQSIMNHLTPNTNSDNAGQSEKI
ncbi:MAG: DUF2520 domain-containing protein [Muribaculaceae bacterium]|nr:DUF2520 domain-containing protein [Muribaculaceae bacterium]